MIIRHTALAAAAMLVLSPAAQAGDAPNVNARPKFSTEVTLQVSRPLSTLVGVTPKPSRLVPDENGVVDIRPERGPIATRSSAPRALGKPQTTSAAANAAFTTPLGSFEGLSNQDNFNVLGYRVNPPDPVGAVGPNHYVEMINLAVAVYDKAGNRLMGPVAIGSLWNGFAVPDCADQSGDPIVVYDQFADRWILSQFTTAGPEYFNCVAISQTADPTGAYYLYAFSTGANFPDYPKYGLWGDSYVITTREFGPTVEYGIGVYALERNKMINGQTKARMVGFFLDGNDPNILPLVGDGLLPAYVDGKQKPDPLAPIPIVGTQDDNASYGATFDALNVFELDVKWRSTPTASLKLAAQVPVASFDSIFPCAPTSRDCLPQPGITNPAQYLDILSYRQRPTWRLAYRNFKTYETMVTAQSVEAAAGVAGMRWYELRRTSGSYSVHQQGTFAPGDGVQRWMGSVAMDRQGNIGMGYSVVNGVDVFPGIRYTGRLAGDPLGQMTLGEGTIVNGTGVQLTTNSRWGDYTSLNVDPSDDCTFWYVNEYYTAAGQASSLAGWQTRIGSFKVPACVPTQ
jgi:hypothetical protein